MQRRPTRWRPRPDYDGHRHAPVDREAECNTAAGIDPTAAPSANPAAVTGLDDAISHVLANCIKNPQAPGLVNAVERLMANQERKALHDAAHDEGAAAAREAAKADRQAAHDAAKAAKQASHGNSGTHGDGGTHGNSNVRGNSGRPRPSRPVAGAPRSRRGYRRKRAGANGARSMPGPSPQTRPATTCPVTGPSVIPSML